MAIGARPGGGPWQVEYRRGSAHDLHQGSAALVDAAPAAGPATAQHPVRTPQGAPAAPDGAVRLARVLSVDRAALVLGSGQPETDVDQEAAAAAGVEIVRRRSGGGAVRVDPGALLWVDLIVPAGDPLWQADVGRATWWVGATWASALETAVGADPEVWRDGMRRSPWSALVCFAGTGPGEVCIEGRKVVGVSQRRTRRAALFQTAALLDWDAAAVLALLRVDDASRAQGRVDLGPIAAGVGREHGDRLLAGFLAALP